MTTLNPNNARPVRVISSSGQVVDSFGGAGLAAAGKQTEISKSSAGATDIAAANPNRIELSFTNNHATVSVRVKEGSDAGAAAGAQLRPGGTYWASTQDRISVCPESGAADCFGYEVVA